MLPQWSRALCMLFSATPAFLTRRICHGKLFMIHSQKGCLLFIIEGACQMKEYKMKASRIFVTVRCFALKIQQPAYLFLFDLCRRAAWHLFDMNRMDECWLTDEGVIGARISSKSKTSNAPSLLIMPKGVMTASQMHPNLQVFIINKARTVWS